MSFALRPREEGADVARIHGNRHRCREAPCDACAFGIEGSRERIRAEHAPEALRRLDTGCLVVSADHAPVSPLAAVITSNPEGGTEYVSVTPTPVRTGVTHGTLPSYVARDAHSRFQRRDRFGSAADT